MIETIVFVTDVPMFAPMTMGMAWGTWRMPEATMPTMMEVVVEELWTCKGNRSYVYMLKK